MALFAIQLVRIVITILGVLAAPETPSSLLIASDFVIFIHQMLNVIIRSVHYFYYFTDDIYSALGYHTNNNFGPDLNEVVLR